MNSHTRQLDLNGNHLDPEECLEWNVSHYPTEPLDLEIYAFLGEVNLNVPSKVLQQYLLGMEEWLGDDSKLMGEQKISLFIDRLWRYYQSMHFAY